MNAPLTGATRAACSIHRTRSAVSTEGVVLETPARHGADHVRFSSGHRDHLSADAVAFLAIVHQPQSEKKSLALVASPVVSCKLNGIVQYGGRASTASQNANKPVKAGVLMFLFIVGFPGQELSWKTHGNSHISD